MNRLLITGWPRLVPFLFALIAGCNHAQSQPGEPPPQEVFVSEPVTQEVTEYEDFPGQTQALQTIEVRARVSGYLANMCFKEGAEVKKGDLLFEIDPRPYRAQLDQDQADLLNKKAMVTKTGAVYRRTASLIRSSASSQEEIDNQRGDWEVAKAAVGQAEAKVRMSQLNLDWTRVTAPVSGRIGRRLIDPWNMVKADETPLTTIVSLDPIYAYFDVDEANALRLIRQGKIAMRGTPEPAQDSTGAVRGSPDPAPGATAGLLQATETFGQANRRGQETRAERGQLNGAAGRPASQSVRAEHVYAGCFDVFLGLGDEEGFPHQGMIDFVDNQIDTNTGTLRMRGIFPNPDRLLSPGLFVRIRLPMGAPHAALLVSEQALGRDQGQKFVFVVSDENKVRYRRVKVGRLYDGLREALPVSGARAVSIMASPLGPGPLLAASALLPGTTLREITEGLRHGEKVVVSGLQRIRDGAPVEPKMVDMLAPSVPPPTPGAKAEGASDQRRSQ